MLSSWAALLFAAIGTAVLGVGLYLLAYHRGYLAGLHERVASLPGDPWRSLPPQGDPYWGTASSAEFMAELLERERKNEPPRKYRREP